MIEVFCKDRQEQVKKQRNVLWIIFIVVAAVYLVLSVGLLLWYLTLPYQSPTIKTVKSIHYPITVVFALFSFILFAIPFRRVNKYYKMQKRLESGLKEVSTGAFLEYCEDVQVKEGVDFKSLVFLEWNKYKNDFYERKVLVLLDQEFPEFSVNMNVKYVTQGNVLMAYEILDEDYSLQN